MKLNTRYILIIIIGFLCSFIYAGLNEKEIDFFNQFDGKSNAVSSLSDSFKENVKGNLNVYYFNVGQADAILLENNSRYMLIDAGNNADGLNIVNYLKQIGVKEFDYLIATHAHEDHIGGMDDIIDNFTVNNFYMPDVVTTTKTFEDLIVSLENKSLLFETPNIGDTFLFGDCKCEILHISNDDSDLNDTSIVIRGVYGNNSFLFMGDASSNVEKDMLKRYIDSDVLKVGHHGSKYSSSFDFLKKVTPLYSIVSVGVGNSYNHPNADIMNRLVDMGSSVYRTDLDGTILVSSDGNEISIEKINIDLDG